MWDGSEKAITIPPTILTSSRPAAQLQAQGISGEARVLNPALTGFQVSRGQAQLPWCVMGYGHSVCIRYMSTKTTWGPKEAGGQSGQQLTCFTCKQLTPHRAH